jgi:hypothetical protein
MNTTTNQSINPNLADAALSLQAVRKYQRDRRIHGEKRVNLYFEDDLGDWLNQLDEQEDSGAFPAQNLSQDLCDINCSIAAWEATFSEDPIDLRELPKKVIPTIEQIL